MKTRLRMRRIRREGGKFKVKFWLAPPYQNQINRNNQIKRRALFISLTHTYKCTHLLLDWLAVTVAALSELYYCEFTADVIYDDSSYSCCSGASWLVKRMKRFHSPADRQTDTIKLLWSASNQSGYCLTLCLDGSRNKDYQTTLWSDVQVDYWLNVLLDDPVGYRSRLYAAKTVVVATAAQQ